ncbi:Protein bcp1 [Termitomyces sp. J132]|nr:Protein bcp1 [Termitomyces sp. J132]
MHVHHEHPSIKAIANYALEKSSADPAFHTTLQALFSQNQSHVALVLSERLINMPVQVIPPMYNMLAREMQWAIDDNEPYTFSHYLFITRNYHLTPEEESLLLNAAPSSKGPTSKKSKKATTTQPVPETTPDGIYPYHPEDECIKSASIHSVDYRFKVDSEPREKDSFGLDTRGRIMLVPGERFPELIAKMSEVPPATMSLFLFSSPSLSPLISLLAKYDTALSLYDDLARDISQMKKATQLVRQKILKLFETKVRRKKALGIQSEALDVLLAAEVKAQQRRKGAGPRKARRWD